MYRYLVADGRRDAYIRRTWWATQDRDDRLPAQRVVGDQEGLSGEQMQPGGES